jgi:transcription elongation GreA/GreB family factor
VNKTAIVDAIVEAIQAEFDTLQSTSQKTRAAGNDAESKAEGKYDTRSIEDNYLADGLARQAHAAAQSGAAYKEFLPRAYGPGSPIEIGALVQLVFAQETHWFFLGPAAGGIEVSCEGVPITLLSPESPLASRLIGLKVGDTITSPMATVKAVE